MSRDKDVLLTQSLPRPPYTTIAVPRPFDFQLTVGHQTYYRGRAGADLYADGTYYRALRRDGTVLVAAVTPDGAERLTVRLPLGGSDDDLSYAAEAMARLLGLDVDLAGFYRLLASDDVLGGAVGSLQGLRPTRSETIFEALVMAIIAQQISGNIARIIREGLVGTFGEPVPVDGYELHAFPSPEALLSAGTDALRAQKLSARKVEYIQDMAQRTIDGTLDPDRFAGMGDDEAIAELTALRGIGRWTAEWVLMRALGRLDLLPAGDLALRKVVAELYFDGGPITEQQLADFALERCPTVGWRLPTSSPTYASRGQGRSP